MRAFILTLAFAAVAACATPDAAQAQAQPAQPAQAAPQLPANGTLVFDTAHTQATFAVQRFGFTTILGRFDNTTGSVTLDQANPANSSVTATIQVASVSSGDATRDGHLRSAFWFNAEQFPTIEFRSTSVRQTGPQTAEVTGDLTMHGVTAPVTLNVTMNRLGPNPATRGTAIAAGFTATTTIQRATFGMNTAAQLIGTEVQIRIEALAAPPAPAQ